MNPEPEAELGDSISNDPKGSASIDAEIQLALTYVSRMDKWPRHKQICICGHTLNSHHYESVSKKYSCEPANFYCACTQEEPVYCASDSRWFKRSTHGVGKKHALVLGIAGLELRGGTGEWMVPPKCQIPECRGVEISIACADLKGRIVPHTAERSLLLCKDHIRALGGSI